MTWTYDDGGRETAGFKGSTGDCVTRAIAIATEIPYREVYDGLYAAARAFVAKDPRMSRRMDYSGGEAKVRRWMSPRDGVDPKIYKPFLTETLGWIWTPTMKVGAGPRTHLLAEELPAGRIIAKCSHHLVAVVDGLVHDTYDPSRDGTRLVYGYWSAP